jgi:N utilization substance protein B
MPVSRKQARREAVFALYQRDVTAVSVEEAFAGLRRQEGRGPDDYTVELVEAAVAGQDDLDASIGDCAAVAGWSVDRIHPLERNIMRVAIVEMRAGLAVEIAVDEAVGLAKRYVTDEAGAFVNGVLGCVAARIAEAA